MLHTNIIILVRNTGSYLFRRTKNFSLRTRLNHSSTLPEENFESPQRISHLLASIYTRGNTYGFHTDFFQNLPSEKIIVEFSSPNIAKTFHVGHYRSTIIGNVISKILSAAGHKVWKMNYLGDWGLQFALIALAFERYGEQTELEKSPLMHLYHLYVRIVKEMETDPQIQVEAQRIFLDMENGNNLKFWKMCREFSIKEYKKLYDALNVEFDVFSGESFYFEKSREILAVLKETNLLHTDENALNINLSDSKWLETSDSVHLHPVLVRKNGTSLYLTRDVAAAIDRYNTYQFDRMIYVTDFSQSEHFNKVFAVLEKMGHAWASKDAGKLLHKSFGRVLKMQTRKGNLVFLQDLLEEAYQRAHEDRLHCVTRKLEITFKDDVTRTLALSGLVYHDLKARLSKGYNFDWKAVLASKGSCGMFLQYAHCRLCSLEANAGIEVTSDIDSQRIVSQPTLVALCEHLNKYTTITKCIYETLEPTFLVKYLYELSHLTGKALIPCRVKDAPLKDAQARLLCFYCARIILGNGLRLLGITPLTKM